MDKNLRILVLGSSGFIGSNLVKQLKEKGHFVVGGDINRPKYVQPDVFFEVDLRNADQTKECFSKKTYDRVYQLAADMGGAGFIFTGANDAEVMHNSALINLNVARYATE